MTEKILIIGGGGFLGQAISNQLHAEQYNFDALDMVGSGFCKYLSENQKIEQNIFELSDAQIINLFKNYSIIIYALGPDDREKVPKNQTAKQFFEKNLSRRTEKISQLAQNSGVRKIIILASYFTYFNQKGLNSMCPNTLATHHPYIKARQLQYDLCKKITGIEKIFIEIPYVFGVIEGKIPIWKTFFIDYFKFSPRIFYGNGGTTVISIEKLSKSVVNAIKYGKNNDQLTIGEKNYKYTELINRILVSSGVRKKVINLPNYLYVFLFKLKAVFDNNLGLNFNFLNQDILSQDFYIDYHQTDKKLHLENYNSKIEQTIKETGEEIRRLRMNNKR